MARNSQKKEPPGFIPACEKDLLSLLNLAGEDVDNPGRIRSPWPIPLTPTSIVFRNRRFNEHWAAIESWPWPDGFTRRLGQLGLDFTWDGLYSLARVDLGMSEDDFDWLTPYRYDCLLKRLMQKHSGASWVDGEKSRAFPENASEPVTKEQFCELVVGEIRTIRHSCLSRGWSMNEHRRQYPDLQVWRVADALCLEDRDTFEHPHRWGPATGYAHKVLGVFYGGKAEETIRSWRKKLRKAKSANKPRDRRDYSST